jgi:hypothetical protein
LIEIVELLNFSSSKTSAEYQSTCNESPLETPDLDVFPIFIRAPDNGAETHQRPDVLLSLEGCTSVGTLSSSCEYSFVLALDSAFPTSGICKVQSTFYSWSSSHPVQVFTLLGPSAEHIDTLHFLFLQQPESLLGRSLVRDHRFAVYYSLQRCGSPHIELEFGRYVPA